MNQNLVWTCKAGGLRDLTDAQYQAQPERIQRHYTRIAAPLPAREPLTDDDILKCVRSIGLPAPMGLVRDRGPYEVTEPTYYLQLLVRAIEAALDIIPKP